MAYSWRTRVATRSLVVLLGSLASLVACGHFSVDLLPAGGVDLDGGSAIDDGIADDASISDGSVDVLVDARDAGCEGPNCPGTYVSDSVGDDTNPGTGEKPVKTIGRAIEIAKTLGAPSNVYIAGGNGQKYQEKVTLVEGVSLLGGYDCSSAPCSWTREILKNLTTIVDQDFEGVLADKSITRATLVEGVNINGKNGAATAYPGTVAMTIAGGAPTVRLCRINGGDTGGTMTNAKRSIGLAIVAPNAKGPLIEATSIKSGASNDESVALYIDRSSATTATAGFAGTITKNVIRSGTGASSAAVVAYPASSLLVIEDNRIDSGNATAANGDSWGILVEGPAVITRNLINTINPPPVCTGGQFCGGIHSSSSGATITNNVVYGATSGRSAAIMLAEAEGAAVIVNVHSNTLDGAGNGGDTSTISAAIATRNSVGVNAVVANARNNILVYGQNSARFGVYETETSGRQAHLSHLENNDFWNPNGGGALVFALHRWDGSSPANFSFDDLSVPGKIPNFVPVGNINADPKLNSDGIHIAKDSPCINTGTADEAPARDYDNDSRPSQGAFDIGADEVK